MHMPAGEVHLGAMKHDQTPFIRVLGGNEAIVQCWKDLLSRSNETGLRQMGMEAYDALRISLGIPAAGHEIAESFNPYDAGLRQDISFTKGCYIGQEVIARLDTYQKIRHRPMGLVLSRGGAPGPGRVVLEKNGGQVGWLTSATRLPVRKKYLGLGIVNVDNVREGDQLEATVDGTPVHCVALNLPLLP
jgi:folate-binding protein YgfZ